MASIKIPTPLRVYANGQATVSVAGETVGAALNDLVIQHPELQPHLFNNGVLRSFVNVFLGEEDVRFLDGLDTIISSEDNLRIIPSIAGGTDTPLRKVDHTGLKTGMAATIILLILAFVLDSALLVAFVGIAQLLGGLGVSFAPYSLLYKHVVRPSGLVKPDVVTDNPEPHRFAMLVGAAFNLVATVLLFAGVAVVPWILVGIVIVLANLNFWLNFCAGCWMYYQFNRLGVPGFTQSPIRG